MKLLIVDRDKDFMKKLSQMIRKNLPAIEIIGRVSGTQEAIKSVLTDTPDAALISKELNDDDGFHVGEEIRKLVPHLNIVYYMEHEKNNDMKRGLEAGAVVMMRTPINKKRIIPVLEAVQNRLERERERTVIVDKNKELIASTNELIEFSFIYSILFNGDFEWNCMRYQDIFGIKNLGYVLYIACDKEDCKGKKYIVYDKYARIIKNIVPEGYRAVIGPMISRRIIVLVLSKEERTREKHLERVEHIKFGEAVKKSFRTIFNVNVRIGLGSERTIDKLSISYEEAMHDIRYDKSDFVMNRDDIEMKDDKHHFYIEMEEEMLQAVRAGSNDAMNNFMVILDILDRYHPEDKKNKIMELLVLASREARREGKNEAEYLNYLELAKSLANLPGDEVNAWAYKNMRFIVNLIQESQDERSFDNIRKVLRHVEKHYEEEFTLEEAARMANMSPQYFSRIFKERTNSNYVEYLTKLRMKKAMEWFDCSDKNIQEVCYHVGYRDPNYFTRVFKKINGMTPKQYIEGKRKHQ